MNVNRPLNSESDAPVKLLRIAAFTKYATTFTRPGLVCVALDAVEIAVFIWGGDSESSVTTSGKLECNDVARLNIAAHRNARLC